MAVAPAATAFVRAVHASPDAGPIDIYVYPQGSTIPTSPGVAGATYPAITKYLSIPAGRYTVAVFAANAYSTGAPVATESVTVAANAQYSIAVAGKRKRRPRPCRLSCTTPHPLSARTFQPVGVGAFDAAAAGNGTPSAATAPAAAQTAEVLAFAFTPGTPNGPAMSGSVAGLAAASMILFDRRG